MRAILLRQYMKGKIAMKVPKNNGKRWSDSDVNKLRKLAAENTPTRLMGLKLGRTKEAIYSKSSEMSLSLKPTNQRPYGTKKR